MTDQKPDRDSPQKPWVIIGCGKKKRGEPGPALDLYCSSYIRTAAAWARSVTSEDRILVLSAKHGLIDSRTVIEPYDVSFPTGRGRGDREGASGRGGRRHRGDSMSAPPVTERVIATQAIGLQGTIITIAGKRYRDILARATGGRVEAVNPFVDLIRARGDVPGMGNQMAVMKQWRGRIPPL